jgi:hypothetical protein
MASQITAMASGTASPYVVQFVGMESGFEFPPALPSTPLKTDGRTMVDGGIVDRTSE